MAKKSKIILTDLEMLALVLSAKLTHEQLESIPEEYRRMLSVIIEKKYG